MLVISNGLGISGENRFRGSPVLETALLINRDVVGRFGLGRVGAIAEQVELPRSQSGSVCRFRPSPTGG
jgi:hypothetical protein